MWTMIMELDKKSLNEEFDEVITEPAHSNAEKRGVYTWVWWTDFLLIIATPPPRDVWGLPLFWERT